MRNFQHAKVVGSLHFGPSIIRKIKFRSYDSYWESGKLASFSEVARKFIDSGGRLVFDVHLQVENGKKRSTWYPKASSLGNNSLSSLGNGLLNNPIGADIWISVGKHDTNDQERRQTFHAHTCILLQRAPLLYDVVKDSAGNDDRGSKRVVEIPNISKQAFKMLLENILYGNIPRY